MSAHAGYYGNILWVDLSSRTSRLEERDEIFWRRYVGGGLLAARLLLEKTTPGIDALGSENLLIFASSVVAGHPGPGLARFTTAAKSPLTGGIGETRTEGPWGVALKGSGADAIVFTGAAEKPVAVMIEDGKAEFVDAGDLWGRQVAPATDALKRRFGADACVAAIGPAGENRVRFASIVTEYAHQAARMGMGAVMGAKRLKAVVLKPGSSRPPVADEAALRRLTDDFDQRILGNDLSKWQKLPPGFSCWLYLHGLDAALCVNNYSRPFDKAQGGPEQGRTGRSAIQGIENFKEEHFLQRCRDAALCPGCPNDCIKRIHPIGAPELDSRASGIHQEVSGAMAVNLGVTDLDIVLRANNLCNQFGMDPTSLGFTISFAMELFERGILTPQDGGGSFGLAQGRSESDRTGGKALRFGDGAGALEMAENIALRRGLGDILAEGSKRAAARIGRGAEQFAMHVKGLEMVPFEPRSQTNLALGYAVAPIGPRYDICEHDWDFDTEVGWDHTLRLARTLGILERIPMGHIGPDKVRNFKALLTLWSGADALDMCIFAIAPTRLLSLPQMAEMLRAVTGWETSSYEIMRAGERRLHLMQWYNRREGLTHSDDRLPDRFYEEPIADGPRKGDVIDRATFHDAIRTFYAMMGWDPRGRPTPATLYDHGLEWVLEAESASVRRP